MSKTYNIDVRKNVELQFNQALQDIILRSTLTKIRERVTKDVDREIGKIFQQLVAWLTTQRSNSASAPAQIQPYLTSPWVELNDRYKAEKQIDIGHTKWFIHGKSKRNKGKKKKFYETQLVEELRQIGSADVLDVVGNSQVIVRRDKSGVTLKLLPNVGGKFQTNYFENLFEDYLSDIALSKLHNRENRYRALVGPAFAYFIDQRIPEIVTNSLRKI